ncbi:MAG: hypothetical protein CMK78_11435 [Pseudomonadales bacterium]|nr:hypothetical protein [Pseudomonadales bacterium]|tara:strand:- start:1883 stop:2098 length:216 start_codon:yes stop_codon:yes gene_type:complete
MGIVELITAIGDDSVKLNALDTCITEMNKRKDHNEFTFCTDQTFDLKGPSDLGIVIWLPRDKVTEIMAAAK